MQSKWKVTSNLQHTCGVVKIFHGKQFDANTRYIEATIMDGDLAFTMPSNPKFMVGIRRADGTEMVYDAIITATPTLGLVVTVDTATYMSHGAINSTFTFDGTNWNRSGTVVDLSAWGITIVSGTPSNGNTIVIATTSAVTYSSNVVTFAVHPNLFLTVGDGCAELYICDGDEIISTFVYTVRVEKAAANLNNAVASTSFAVITAQIESYVNAWLTAHPEATTTVEDGAVTTPKIADGAVTSAKLDSDLNASLAKTDGLYENMTVGNAEQLVSTVGVDDNAPYNFRTSGGSADIGDRETDMIVGGTVAWNQLCPATAATKTLGDVTVTNNGDGTFTLNGTYSLSSSSRFQFGTPAIDSTHKYLVRGISGGSYTKGYFCVTNSGVLKSPAVYNDGIFAFSGNGNQFSLRITTKNTVYDNFVVAPQIFDLTAMFGSTIADYAYTLESGTAGSGIAWLQKYGFFTKPYYAYDVGGLQSVNTNAHKTVGFNAYDNSTGKAKVVGGKYYQITGAYTALSLNGTTVTTDASGYFTPTESGELTVTGGNGTTTCIHLVWDGERDDDYEQYEEHSYALDSDLTLRGIPKVDANGNLYYDGDTYESDGTVTRYWGERAYTSGDATDGSTMITDGTITVYKLTTPTTESADPYQNPQIVDDWGTEEYVDAKYAASNRDFPMPCGHETTYAPNLRAKLEMSPNSPDGYGYYLVRQTNGVNVYVPFSEVKELPDLPTTDGTYVLKCTVVDGTPSLSWVSE